MITGYGDVATAVEGMQAGAVDFIEKPFRARVLLDQIQRSIAMDAHNLRIQSASDRAHQGINLLNQEESAVLELVADGKTGGEIAQSLSISAKAVAGHRANVMRKLGVKTLADLLSLYLHYLRSGPQKERNG
jgi:FixJ family two-component response regulator